MSRNAAGVPITTSSGRAANTMTTVSTTETAAEAHVPFQR